jgi:hypothetical protein
VAAIAACIVLTLLLLAFSYPPWDKVRYSSYTWGDTASAYLLVAIAASVIVAGVAPSLSDLIVQRAGQRPTLGTVLTFVFTLFILTPLSIALGPGPLDAPGRIVGIFFSEWQFVTFIVRVVLPLAFVGGATYIYRFRS